MGIKVVVRDGRGEVLVTLSSPRNHITEPDIAEAVAAVIAAHLCQELSFYRMILEGDALQVVQALKRDGRSWSQYGHLIEEARGVLNCLHRWKVNHIRRHLNEAAHRLAKEALSLIMEEGSFEEIPLCISDIISVKRCA